MPGLKVWEKYEADGFEGSICTPPANAIYESFENEYKICPNSTGDVYCGSPLDHGLLAENDGINANGGIQFGVGSFDDIKQSLIAVFQLITLDSWSVILYNLQDWNAVNAVPALFCISLILLGSFFLLNLLLAVVMESYMTSEMKEDVRIAEELVA